MTGQAGIPVVVQGQEEVGSRMLISDRVPWVELLKRGPSGVQLKLAVVR